MYNDCPGARQFKQATPEFIPCRACHAEVEIWTDEVEVKCHECGETVSRERLGEKLYSRLVASHKKPGTEQPTARPQSDSGACST